jgi:hypothetical protein
MTYVSLGARPLKYHLHRGGQGTNLDRACRSGTHRSTDRVTRWRCLRLLRKLTVTGKVIVINKATGCSEYSVMKFAGSHRVHLRHSSRKYPKVVSNKWYSLVIQGLGVCHREAVNDGS